MNVMYKKKEKTIEYQDLARKIMRIWNISTKIRRVVISALSIIINTLVSKRNLSNNTGYSNIKIFLLQESSERYYISKESRCDQILRM